MSNESHWDCVETEVVWEENEVLLDAAFSDLCEYY